MERSPDTTPDSEPAPFRDAWRPQRRPRSRLQQALTALSGQADQNGGLAPRQPETHDLPWEPSGAHGRPTDEPADVPVSATVVTTPDEPDQPTPEASIPGASPLPLPGPLPASGEDPIHVIVDVTPRARDELATVDSAHYGMGDRWGTQWQGSAQGWVGATREDAVWRPVVSTTQELSRWVVDTYLGVVTAEVAIEAHGGDLHHLGSTLAEGRAVGHRGLIEEAVERGAHAVIGVSMNYTPLGDRLLITLTGTAVTLRDRT
ncbi:MAG: YbjQ family protein [Acidimicrobiia bacterium]|nr:YbjQ family protein [Acidimicrobiia bacterium]